MPRVTLTFDLPDERGSMQAALAGQDALLALWDIDNKCRGLLKHGNLPEETDQLIEEIRRLVPMELLDLLE
jgi:hypothetical protein